MIHLSFFIKRLLIVLSICLSFQANAHQLKQAITTILFNPRTDNIEVMHRFELHDAEHAVKQIFKDDIKTTDIDIMADPDTQEKFSQYVVERFSMFNKDQEMLALKTVGYEVERKHFWVYQETSAPDSLEGLYIEHNALRDIWQSQINTINVEGKGAIKTLTFSDNIEMLKVVFEHH